MQRALGQRVGHEVVGAEPQQFAQRRRADVMGDQDAFHPARLGRDDQLSDHAEVHLVLGGDRDGEELQLRGLGLIEEGARFGEAQIAPGLPQLGFHVLDQKVEAMHVLRHRAGLDAGRF